MTDTEHLREKIEEAGMKYCHLAERLGHTQQGLRRKINNETEFKVSKVKKLAEILNINLQEQREIFFAGM